MNFADLSHHQPTFSLPQYRNSRPVIALKATEGTGFVDNRFAERWKMCAGMPRIAYHFARAKFNGADEYRHLISVVQSTRDWNPAKDVIALDVEDDETPARALANAQEFMAAAVANGHTRGLIYTYPSYVTEHKLYANNFPTGWRRLWYANYSAVSDPGMPMPPGWDRSQLYARQYTDKAAVAGVGVCDDSRILRAWWTETNPPPVETPGQSIGSNDMVLVAAQTGVVLIVGDQRYGLNPALVGELRRQGVPMVDMTDNLIPGLYELGTKILEGTPQI